MTRSGFVTTATTLDIGSTDADNSTTHGETLHARHRDSFPTNFACRAPTKDPQTDPDTPPPTQHPGRSRGRVKWRAPQKATPGIGTRSKTRQAELDAAEATQAQASRAVWPESPDSTAQIQRMTRNLQIRPTHDTFREVQRTLPMHKTDENQNEIRPPAVGIHTHQHVFFIPPRALVVALWGSQPL